MADAWSYSNFQKGLKAVAPVADTLATKKGDIKQSRDVARNILYDAIGQGKTDLGATSYADAHDLDRHCQALRPAEADALLKSLGTDRVSLSQAMEDGLDIETPTENLMVMEGGAKPEVQALFRPNPSMKTASSMRDQLDALTQTFELAEQTRNTILTDIERGAVPETVSALYRDLMQRGQTPTEARNNTALLWSWIRTTAERRGMTPEDFSRENVVHDMADALMRNNSTLEAEVQAGQEGQTEAEAARPNPTADRIIPMEGAEAAPSLTQPAVTEGDTKAWLDEAAGNVMRELGLEGEQFAPLAAEVRKAMEQGINDPDVRALAEQLGLELPTPSGAPMAAMETESAPGEGNAAADATRQAATAAISKEAHAAAVEADSLDSHAAELETALASGDILTPTDMNRLGVRAGDREALATRAAELREEAGRWRDYRRHPDIFAQVQERAGTPALPDAVALDSHIAEADVTVKAIADYGNFFDEALTERKVNQPYRDILPISQHAANMIKEKLGLDVGRAKHGADGSKIRHSDNEHGAGKEQWKNQGGIDRDSFELVPMIVNFPDDVYDGGDVVYHERTSGAEKRLKRILFEKKIGDTYYVVEEVRKKGQRLAFTTMWKKSSGESGVGQTSETPPHLGRVPRATDSPLQDTIPSPTALVKPDATQNQADAKHRQAAVIRLLRKADRSTVPNGLAQVFFDDMRRWVMSGQADNAARRDYAALVAWAGRLSVDSGLEPGTPEYASQKAEAEANIRKVSKGFEQYLREGRAPSLELVDSFSLFSGWLNRVYANVREHVGLDDSVREVYGRWLASDAEIAEAKAFYGGQSDIAFANLLNDDESRRRLADMRRTQDNRLRQRYAGDMVGSYMESQAAREEVIAETEREIAEAPVYRAIDAAKGNHLDRAGAVAIVGEQAVKDIAAKHGDIRTIEVLQEHLEPESGLQAPPSP